MAARNFGNETHVAQPGVFELFLKGPGAGAANITLTHGLGVNPTLVYAATGKYTITLSDKWAALLHYNGAVIDATTEDDWEVVVLTETVASTKTIQIAVFKGGTAAALTTDEILMLRLTMLNTSAIPVKGA
jgi:hypothetical protein